MAKKVALFKEDAPPVWVPWEDGARVKFRALSQSELKKLRKECTSTESVLENGRFIERDHFDEEKFDRERYTRMIVAWEEIVDVDGNPLPVTPETKYMMCDQVPSFWLFIHTAAAKYQDFVTKREEALAENLSDSQAGSNGKSDAKPAGRDESGEPAKSLPTAGPAGQLN